MIADYDTIAEMSQNDDKAVLERSVKLCQLICDRQIDNEISFEIRKLLEQGVLIDFQDQNRHKKTALHLAVEKGDVTCVKFLLRFRPSLESKYGDGKTPIELARSKGFETVLNVLLNNSVDVVNESCIEVVDFKSLTRQKIEAIKLRPTFKVLKLINCPSVKTVLRKITHRAYVTTFEESSHLFFIAIETKETKIEIDHQLMKKVWNIRKPMIVQLSSSKSKNIKIYFKDDKRKHFVEITKTSQITQEEFEQAVQSEDDCNMKLLVAALRSNLFGYFTGNLLDIKLNTNESRREAVNKFARSNVLCHRFFKLFDEGQPQIETIVAALSFKGDQSLLALLDLPFELRDEKLKLTEYQKDIMRVVDCCGYNLLMLAAEINNLAAIKLSLRCGCDFNHSDSGDTRSSDICWDVKAFDCLAELIEAGSPYPNNFSIDKLDESTEALKRINAMNEVINSFHEHIEDGNTEEVKKFITRHPHIKHAFNTNNKCALTVALQRNQIDIYSLLMSKGFEPGADDEYHTALDKSSCKDKIRNSHKKYFKEAFDEPHLKRIFKMFRLSFGSKDQAKCSMIIRKMFDELNVIDEIIPILQICSTSDKLKIVFDFNCDSVVDMVVETGSRSLGIVYPIEDFIYIGAKNYKTEFYEVIGTLIHELTHYAMKLTYDNSCRPYTAKDIVNRNCFVAIEKGTKMICDKNPSTDSIVTTVFSCYSDQVWHQELIVRVPQLLAHYKEKWKSLKAAERNTPELFHFYREKTLKDVERKSQVLLQEYLISKINKQTGIARKIEKLQIKFEKVENIDLKSSVNIITSNAPQLTLAMLRQVFEPDSHIFVTLEQVTYGNILDKLGKLNERETLTALIVDCIGLTQKYPESLRNLSKKLKNIKTIAFVMAEGEGLVVKEIFSSAEFKTYDHKWAELTESTQGNLLNKLVTFQGVKMTLNAIVKPSSEAMNFFPLFDILDREDFKIGSPLHQPLHKFYIDSKLSRNGGNAKRFDALIRDDTESGIMIISDEAGRGKSVTLYEIAKCLHGSYPDRWILFVDLKHHIEAFKCTKNYEGTETFHGFILDHILKNETEFDRVLFKEMFLAGKAFILLDAFDEISPNYKDLLLHFLKLFDPKSGNQLYITTRPHLESDLEDALGKFLYKLEEFSGESQKSFLREHWRKAGVEISREDFEILSKRLLERFSEIAASKFIGLPLLMRMTAEIFDDKIKENLLCKLDSLSIASVFQEFVEKYFLRWTNNENEISRSETVEYQMTGGVLEVHHNIALNHIFCDELMSFDVDEGDAEKIARVGLIRFDQGFDETEKTFEFIHQTFAEYFVADFICFHFKRKNRKPKYDCSKAIEVLVEVLYDRCDHRLNTKIITIFLDQAFEAINFGEAFCKSVAKCLSEVLKSKNNFEILDKSMRASTVHLVCLLLSIIRHVEKDVLLKVLKTKTFSGYFSVLHIAADSGSKTTVSTLCDIITNCTENPKEIYHDEGYSENVLFRAACNKNKGVLTTLCASLNSVFTKEEIKMMFQQKIFYESNIVHHFAVHSNDDVFLELFSILREYLSPDEVKTLLQAVDCGNENFFQRAVTRNTNESLKLKFDVVTSNFDNEEQKIFFNSATNPNIFFCAARNRNEKIFQAIVEFTRDVLSKDEIKSMLMQKYSGGSNMLHIIARLANKIVLNEVNSLLRERLTDDEIRSLLLEVDNEGQSCFHLASNNTELSSQVFCEIIGNLLPIEDQNRLLHDIDNIHLALASGKYKIEDNISIEKIKLLLPKQDYRLGCNIFQTVARGGDVETWRKLISFGQSRFSADEIKSFLFSSDESGENCLHQAVSKNRNASMIEAICETIRTVGLSVDDQKMFVQEKDKWKRNVFHEALRNDKCSSLHDGLSTILSKDEIKEMWTEKDSEGDHVLLCCKRVIMGEPCDLIAFLRKIFTNDEVKNFLFDVDRSGENFFHYTVRRSSKFKIKPLIEAIKEILSKDDLKRFFGTKSPNVFHLAVENSNSEIFSTLHECLKDVLTQDEVKSLIQEKNSKNRNVLHLICRNYYERRKCENTLRDFLKVLKHICDADEIKKVLTSSDSNGSNCLLLAAIYNRQLFLKELFRLIQGELSVDEQRELIQKYDNDGYNIFACASIPTSWNRGPDISSLIEKFATEILLESQITEMKKKILVGKIIKEKISFF